MFNSTILDVAIGMIFVYLLLSLMCSAANELVELALKKRAQDLERGLCELLNSQTNQTSANIVSRAFNRIKNFFARLYSRITGKAPEAATGLVAEIYNHPLINGLFKGTYQPGARTLPAYIPATNFALALMDLVPTLARQEGQAAPISSGALNAMASPPATPPPTTAAYRVVVNLPPGEGAAIPQLPAPPAPPNPLTTLRNAVANLPDDYEKARNALLPLIDSAGNDATKARQNIETWFNSSMDRVSGWYKRRSQVIVFVIGLFVAIAVNADSIIVAKRLSTDKALRDSLVNAAQEYAKANATASPTPTPTPPKATTAAEASQQTPKKPTPSPTPTATPRQTPSPPATTLAQEKKAASSASPSPTPCWKDACKDNEDSLQCKDKKNKCAVESCYQEACEAGKDSPQCKLKMSQCQLDALSLPIGWSDSTDRRLQWPGWHFRQEGGWWWQLYWHWLGWLLTALAISLGAPFWFDMLNKFIVVRSTVKPKEKSPEEKSKD